MTSPSPAEPTVRMHYVITGVANEWSIAWAVAKQIAQAGGACHFMSLPQNLRRVQRLIAELDGDCHALYPLDVASETSIDEAFALMRTRTDRLARMLFNRLCRYGGACRGRVGCLARGIPPCHRYLGLFADSARPRAEALMAEGSSIIALTYYGAQKCFPGYDIMGVAKAALEALVRYLAVGFGVRRRPCQRDLSWSDAGYTCFLGVPRRGGKNRAHRHVGTPAQSHCGHGRCQHRRLPVLAAGGRDHGAMRLCRQWTEHYGRGMTTDERPVLLFTGQGAQFPGMGLALYHNSPFVRKIMDRCEAIFVEVTGRSLLDAIGATTEDDADAPIHRTEYAQPALFMLELAVAQLCLSFDVVPAAVSGHSVGEIAAACFAGVMDVDAGMRLVTERGRLMQSLPPGGGMLAVRAPEERVRNAIAASGLAVDLAAVNGPRAVVVAGCNKAIAAFAHALDADAIVTQPLRVSHAFHSALMDPILSRFNGIAAGFSYRVPRVPMISNVTGDWLRGAPDAKYWAAHIRKPVRFCDGILKLLIGQPQIFAEVGPQAVLLNLVRQAARAATPRLVPLLSRERGDVDELREAIGTLGRSVAAGRRAVMPAGDDVAER